MIEIQNLESLSSETLLSKTKNLVAQERNLTAQILHYLSEIQRRRLYSELGYSSLFIFCVKHLGFTESQTQRRIEAMRAIREIPQIEEKIKDGTLSLTALAQAQSYFRQNETPQDKKIEVLEKLENKSTRECEKVLLELSPKQEPPKEKLRQVTGAHVQITVSISNELQAKLEKIKNLLSHKNSKMSHAELLNEMAEICLRKLDPQKNSNSRGAEGAQKKNNAQKEGHSQPIMNSSEKLNSYGPANSQRIASTAPKVKTARSIVRPYIPTKTRRLVWQKYDGKCSFVSPSGIRCDSQFQIQLDHLVPVSFGGSSGLSNLRLLCASHNKWAAIQTLGFKKMEKYLGKG
jgi:5-methylcytosine-specific restriction endonuclease McrA